MGKSDEIETTIGSIFSTVWGTRDGQVVPTTDDVALSNGAVKLDAVLLYADLAHSTEMVRALPRSVAAKLIRAYLSAMTTLIRSTGGEVRSFDGDRVMGVYIGDGKNSQAAKCALQMNYIVERVLRPKAEAKFPSLKTKGILLQHCAGVAASEVWVVRTGIRGHNDLVFVGSAPNIAAKLSDIRNSPHHSYITWDVYNNLNEASKYGPERKDMWESVYRTIGEVKWHLYKSLWTWKP